MSPLSSRSGAQRQTSRIANRLTRAGAVGLVSDCTGERRERDQANTCRAVHVDAPRYRLASQAGVLPSVVRSKVPRHQLDLDRRRNTSSRQPFSPTIKEAEPEANGSCAHYSADDPANVKAELQSCTSRLLISLRLTKCRGQRDRYQGTALWRIANAQGAFIQLREGEAD